MIEMKNVRTKHTHNTHYYLVGSDCVEAGGAALCRAVFEVIVDGGEGPAATVLAAAAAVAVAVAVAAFGLGGGFFFFFFVRRFNAFGWSGAFANFRRTTTSNAVNCFLIASLPAHTHIALSVQRSPERRSKDGL